MINLSGVYTLGTVSPSQTTISFDFSDKLPEQVASYVRQIVHQSHQLAATPIEKVIIKSNNKLTLPKDRLFQLKAKQLQSS